MNCERNPSKQAHARQIIIKNNDNNNNIVFQIHLAKENAVLKK